MTPEQYTKKIRKYNRADLLKLWKQVLQDKTPGWAAGMAFQYLIIRVFEIEKNEVVYPYSVKVPGTLTDSEGPERIGTLPRMLLVGKSL
jgi:hypothetical protein